MRLASFILGEMEAILAEWEAFAASLLPAATGMTQLALRDHAQQILEAVARDLGTPQTRHEQSEKSKGHAPRIAGAAETAAQTHAVLRAASGFDINQLVAEYRALRASVLRLWIDARGREPLEVGDITRFNEAIDQAIAESVGHFQTQVERGRDLLLGMLGHDMQSPLSSIMLTAKYLGMLDAGEEVSLAANRLLRSGASMQALLDDLMDFNRTRLGVTLPVKPEHADLAQILADELEQLRAAHPKRRIDFAVTGDTRGQWDRVRMQQVLRNLVANAARYGTPDTPIQVALRGEEDRVTLEVRNTGPTIDAQALKHIFEPLKRGPHGDSPDYRAGLGLGLFIVREIVRAHRGDVGARSDAGQTTFTVQLPRERGGRR